MKKTIRLRLGLLMLGLLVACGGSWRRPQKEAGSALWLGPATEGIEVSDLRRLERAGVGEVFLSAGSLDGDLGELEAFALPELPSGTRATLVVEGRLPAELADPEAAGAGLAARLRQLWFDAEAAGLVPVGLHLDTAPPEDLVAYGELLASLRQALPRSALLSTTLERRYLGTPELDKWVDQTDFVVPFVYGQRVREVEDPKAWDYLHLQRNLEQVEELGVPYMVGVVALGTMAHVGTNGKVKARTTRGTLREVLWNRDFKLSSGFSLEGANRKVYQLQAERPTQVGRWQLKSGESIRIVRSASSDLEELQRLLVAWDLPGRLGLVYYRKPRPHEGLSLGVDNLLNVLDPTPATPQVELQAHIQRRTGRGYMLRFSVHNANGETSGLSLIDSNFIQVRTKAGTFHRVDVGDFYRYDLFHGEDRTYRDADGVRLHMVILEGFQKLSSGDIELRGTGSPQLELSAQFLLTDGRTLEVGPVLWKNGELVGEEGQGP